MKKYTWKVDEVPTGPYRSFQKRGWPECSYEGNKPAARILSATGEEYYPCNVKSGSHDPLVVVVMDYSRRDGNCPWTRKKSKKQFSTLKEAKAWFDDLVSKNPQIMPEELR